MKKKKGAAIGERLHYLFTRVVAHGDNCSIRVSFMGRGKISRSAGKKYGHRRRPRRERAWVSMIWRSRRLDDDDESHSLSRGRGTAAFLPYLHYHFPPVIYLKIT